MRGYGVTCILFVCVGYVWYVCPMYSVHTVFVQACHMCDNTIYMQYVWHMCVVYMHCYMYHNDWCMW